MGTFVGRYTPVDVGRSASYDTLDEQAAAFVTQLNAATHADALPDVATGATAKWVTVPTVAAASTSGATTTYKDDTVIDLGVRHLRVTAPDVDSTADVEVIATAIDQAGPGSMTVDGAMASAVTTTFVIHGAEDAVGTIIGNIVDIDGFCYLLVGDEAEIVKVTDWTLATHTMTVERGALGSTPSATWDDDEPLYWYCGPDNTVVYVDDPSVWGTVAAHTTAGGTLVAICGTEQMLVTEIEPTGTGSDAMVVERGYDGTTAVLHLDNAAVSRYYDEDSAIIDVEAGHGALLLDEAFYKFATGGLEVIQVKTISTDRITVERAQNGSASTMGPIADDTALFRCWGPEVLDAALTAVNATVGMPDFEEYGGPPINTLGYSPGGAVWSSETQVSAE